MHSNIKKIEIKRTVSTITMEHNDTNYNGAPVKELTALACLLGGYNQYGRVINEDIFKDIQERFNGCIKEIHELLYNPTF